MMRMAIRVSHLMQNGMRQHNMIKRRAKSNEEKTSNYTCSILCDNAAASTIGSTKATLTYMSDNYLAQIDIKSIGVTLTENGNDVSWRDYKHKDDDWSEATGVLLGDMLKNAGDEKLILDKKYDEKLAVKNSGSIDEYVRVTVQHYWADKETGDKLSNLDPSNIQIDFTNDGWTEDKSAETTERNVFYYNSILKKVRHPLIL